MNLDDEISVNQYAQGLINSKVLRNKFDSLNTEQKRGFLTDLIHLIIQSKAINEDIPISISNSGLKQSFTPCVLLSKGVSDENLYRIARLPEDELNKVFDLFLSLFAIAYNRRYQEEKNSPNKWWYWDLSNPQEL